MNIIIQSALKTLQKSELLLTSLSNEELCDTSIPPYHSSIGSHLRHILDFYDCALNINSDKKVDLTARSRNKDVESKCSSASEYLNSIMSKLNNTRSNMNDMVTVIDDLGLGKIEMQYTFGALISQANSHTIHHYAIINYIIDRLEIKFNDEDFGYNPTTPKVTTLN
jgi:hypothetical protein